MPLLYLALGALAGMIITMLLVKPKRCQECLHRQWIEVLKHKNGNHHG